MNNVVIDQSFELTKDNSNNFWNFIAKKRVSYLSYEDYNKLLNWCQPIVDKLSNDSLFSLQEDYNQPDDYDNCFTDSGSFLNTLFSNELIKRLKNCGFLSPRYGEIPN
jgi:hypothetical protein